MAVGIYTSTDPSSLLSQDGAFTHPFAITFDGRIGGYKETKLYIRNDNPLYYYTDLQLSLEDTGTIQIIDNSGEGFAWKLSYGDAKPTYLDWVNTAANNTLSIDDLGASGDPDTSTYLPFWIFVQVPASLAIQTFTDPKFVLSGTENLV